MFLLVPDISAFVEELPHTQLAFKPVFCFQAVYMALLAVTGPIAANLEIFLPSLPLCF